MMIDDQPKTDPEGTPAASLADQVRAMRELIGSKGADLCGPHAAVYRTLLEARIEELERDAAALDAEGGLHCRELVSSVRVRREGAHARVEVWTRGGKAGVLVFEERDVGELLRRLVPRSVEMEDAGA